MTRILILIGLTLALSAVLLGCDSASSGLPTTPHPEGGTATTADSDEPDRAVLVALYNATNGPDWLSNDNWLSDRPLSEWYGVITDDLGYVTELRLQNNDVGGELPPELGQLSRLRRLLVHRDTFSALLGSAAVRGEIPAELGQLTNLEELNLTDNALSGEIPAELGRLPNLEILFLGENRLTGMIPTELRNLSELKELNLRYNDLSGEIPAELGQLSNLLELRLDGNALSGEIPAELSQLSNLLVLELDDNELSGEIPAELGQLPNLLELRLNENVLSGEIPAELGQLSIPMFMDLIYNDSSEEITPELSQLTILLSEYILHNDPYSYFELFGGFPAAPDQLSGPEVFALWNNVLSIETPAKLGQNLSHLLGPLSAVQDMGDVTRLFNLLSSLETLKLADNTLSGCVPSAFGDVENNDFDELGLPFCEPDS